MQVINIKCQFKDELTQREAELRDVQVNMAFALRHRLSRNLISLCFILIQSIDLIIRVCGDTFVEFVLQMQLVKGVKYCSSLCVGDTNRCVVCGLFCWGMIVVPGNSVNHEPFVKPFQLLLEYAEISFDVCACAGTC